MGYLRKDSDSPLNNFLNKATIAPIWRRVIIGAGDLLTGQNGKSPIPPLSSALPKHPQNGWPHVVANRDALLRIRLEPVGATDAAALHLVGGGAVGGAGGGGAP